MIGRLSSCPTFTLLSLIVLFLQASTDLLLPDEPQLKMYNDRERMLPRFDSLANKFVCRNYYRIIYSGREYILECLYFVSLPVGHWGKLVLRRRPRRRTCVVDELKTHTNSWTKLTPSMPRVEL